MMIGYNPGFGGLAHVFALFFGAIGSLIGLAVVVALVFLLVRFLWFATIAARLYIAKNQAPVAGVDAAEPVVPASEETAPHSPGPVGAPVEPSTAPSSVAPSAAPATPSVKPRTPRAPKTPPTDKP